MEDCKVVRDHGFTARQHEAESDLWPCGEFIEQIKGGNIIRFHRAVCELVCGDLHVLTDDPASQVTIPFAENRNPVRGDRIESFRLFAEPMPAKSAIQTLEQIRTGAAHFLVDRMGTREQAFAAMGGRLQAQEREEITGIGMRRQFV